MKIFLDDQINEPGMPNRQVPDGFVGVRNFEEFKQALEDALARGEKIEALDFDNDLGGEGMDGWEIAKWLTKEHPEIFAEDPELRIHSQNQSGVDNINYFFDLGRRKYKELIEAKSMKDPWGEEGQRLH